MRPRSFILQRHYLSGRTLANICYLSCYVFLVGKKSRAEGCSARKGFSDASYKNSGYVLFNFLFFFCLLVTLNGYALICFDVTFIFILMKSSHFRVKCFALCMHSV